MDEQNPTETIEVDEGNSPENPTGVESDQPVEGATVPENPTDGTEEESKASYEELKELNARNQQLYQSLVQKTKEYDPSIYDEHRAEISEKSSERTVEPELVYEEDADDYTTKKDLRENLQSMEDRIFERMTLGEKKKQQSKIEDQAKREFSECDKALDEFLDANNIPDDVLNKALAIVKPMRIKVGTKEKPILGGPSSFVYAVATVLGPYIQAQARMIQNKTHLGQIEVDAADRGRNAGLSIQPEGGRLGITQPGAGQKKADEIAPDNNYVYQP